MLCFVEDFAILVDSEENLKSMLLNFEKNTETWM